MLWGLQVGGWGEPHGKGFYVLEDGSKHEGEVPILLCAHALRCEGGVSPRLGRAGEASAAAHLHACCHSLRTGAPSGGVYLRGPTASATKASGRTGSLTARCVLPRVGMGQTAVLRPMRLFRPVLPRRSIILASALSRLPCAMRDARPAAGRIYVAGWQKVRGHECQRQTPGQGPILVAGELACRVLAATTPARMTWTPSTHIRTCTWAGG